MMPEFFESARIIMKILTLIGLGVYILFAFVIVRQEKLMRNILKEEFEYIIRLAIYLHLAFSIFLFILAILILP